MMQASAAAPISGIPVLEIVPGDIPVTVLAERSAIRPSRAPRRSLREVIEAERARADEPPTTKRGPELMTFAEAAFHEARTERIFAEEPASLQPQLLKAHRRTFWLAASTITAWLTVLAAAVVWMVTSAVWPQRAEAAGVSVPRIAPPAAPAEEPAPEAVPAPVAPAPAVTNKPVVAAAPVVPVAPAESAEETPAEAASEEAPPSDPATSDIENNPYVD